ncbi:hypothetical protein ASE66_23780 [Bosea sp. Root483D1]|uniref:hypothetical protein n=1 Tax=Bosea sp. Root483D1 TaxID=1736544 RepID=UPI000709A2AF|nr:hypothetical protein [Bosea sp. Root483D1]KRE11563.1 hypothetical protein ASE66_23780 [Bosea sp. Root483D1]
MTCDCERLAEALYREIEKQLPERFCDRALDNRDLHSVLIDGQLDLVKIAASLATRFCVLADDLETVVAEAPRHAVRHQFERA